ncbi:hypothetical protein SAMN06265375_1011217 [Muriicola jejuensis]|uniref:L,D-transpeptidase family protein n=1 Tax=Muriicola jejuensis TaxID=504488 RepID=A0A6P0UBN1_9FLAO|nr:hypothetical protein [Muriicola jejuensis]NER09289.1 hypothetical protein [Muriicola jejuensis]SMP09748.1 hypothetical protein SAMN06265375_1011217 [Muriicola jejuensis]
MIRNLIYAVTFLTCLSLNAQIDPGLLLGLINATTVEMNTITGAERGAVLYNTTEGRMYVFNGASWERADPGSTDDQTLQEALASGNDAGSQRIINLGNPTGSQDATNKSYVDNLPRVYVGAFQINGTGNLTISGLPFQPTSITFSAHANVDDFNLDADNGIRNNERGLENSFGSMNGFARDNGSSIAHQVIYVGGHGNSINDISRYASSSHCIGIRYGNQNGDNLGLTTARITQFNPDGFTVNTDNYTDALLIMYTAYR